MILSIFYGGIDMQYLVKTKGDVIDKQSKAYIVEASTKEEAQLIAQNSFKEDFYNVTGEVITKPYSRNRLAYISFVLMTFAIFLSFIGWKLEHDTILIRPDLTSCIYAVIIYSAFVIRIKGVERTLGSWIDVVYCLLNILLLASFIKIILFNDELSFLGFFNIPIDSTYLMIGALVLSWLGLKLVSVICMGLVCILALFNINLLNEAMGSLWGIVYVLCSFFGILIYFRNEPAIYELKQGTKSITSRGMNYIDNDLHEAHTQASHFENHIKDKLEKKRIVNDNCGEDKS